MKRIILIALSLLLLIGLASCSSSKHNLHEYGEWTVTKEATCTTNGEMVCECTVCGYEYSKVIEAHHSWKDASCTSAKTCSVCGTTQGSAPGHKYNESGKCKTCKEDLIFETQDTTEAPLSINSINGSDITSTCIIESIENKIEINDDGSVDLTILLSGKKTFDKNGENNNASCKISYKLYDENNFVIASGTIDTHILSTNDSFKNVKITFSDIKGSSYSLEFIDYIKN